LLWIFQASLNIKLYSSLCSSFNFTFQIYVKI
jgi:hypothetical protein